MVLTEQRGHVDVRVQTSMQTSLFGAAPLHVRHLDEPAYDWLDDRSRVLFEAGWLHGSDRVFEQLRTEMSWRSMTRPMYDRIVAVPRLICTVKFHDLASEHPLRVINGHLQDLLGVHFTSVGLNYYRTGDDSVAWHRDSIGRTGIPATVALVSLGSPRTLAMRRFAGALKTPTKTAETTRSTPATARRWRLGHGDLLVMAGACQRDWEHAVPKQRDVGARISLAFRCKEAA